MSVTGYSANTNGVLIKSRDLSRLHFSLGGIPQNFQSPPYIFFGQNYIFFTIDYLLFIVFFLRATAGTAIARLSHRNSVRLSVRPSVTRVDQATTVQARIIKSSPSAGPRTLVSGSVTLFQKFRRGHPNRGP